MQTIDENYDLVWNQQANLDNGLINDDIIKDIDNNRCVITTDHLQRKYQEEDMEGIIFNKENDDDDDDNSGDDK